MKELKLRFHLSEWFIKPEYKKDRRLIIISFLFMTLTILKNK